MEASTQYFKLKYQENVNSLFVYKYGGIHYKNSRIARDCLWRVGISGGIVVNLFK